MKYQNYTVQQVILEVINNRMLRGVLDECLESLADDYRRLAKRHRPGSDLKDEYMYMARHIDDARQKVAGFGEYTQVLVMKELVKNSCSFSEICEIIFHLCADILNLLDHEEKNMWVHREL